MIEIKTVKIHALLTAASPITHMKGTSGNEAIINRESVLHNGEVVEVPMLSGNAIRHNMVREPGAYHLIEKCRLVGKLNIEQANFMFNGGSLIASSTTDNLKKIADMQELLPLYHLLGGCLSNQIIGGSLLCGRGVLVCEENREVLDKILPNSIRLPENALRGCEDFVSGWQYTRSDANKRTDLISETDGDSNLMIYNGQHIIPGAVFYIGFILQNINRLELGAIFNAFKRWKDSGGIIGGQSRIGHGKFDIELFIEESTNFFGDEIDTEAYSEEYSKHVENNSAKITDWLNNTFPSKTAKVTKTKEAV
ncbi:hypothetical protein FACS1894105_10430 [Clostridia bacterium]|nr:hypothetical protein FACS1894105_10430 [Clostridia bacterium]